MVPNPTKLTWCPRLTKRSQHCSSRRLGKSLSDHPLTFCTYCVCFTSHFVRSKQFCHVFHIIHHYIAVYCIVDLLFISSYNDCSYFQNSVDTIKIVITQLSVIMIKVITLMIARYCLMRAFCTCNQDQIILFHMWLGLTYHAREQHSMHTGSRYIQWSLRIKDTLGAWHWEAVLWWEVRATTESTRVMPIGAIASVLYTEVVLWWEGPLHCSLARPTARLHPLS